MYPVLLTIGPLTLYSFGLMAAIAFLAGYYVVVREFGRTERARKGLGGEIVFSALIGGLVGARVYYFIEHWAEFIAAPLDMIISGAGFVWYGGLAGGTLAVFVLCRLRAYSLARAADAIAPALALGYGIGRIGCFLSGDGDYGPPSDLPWAMAFPNGMVPTTQIVHPTPLYEALLAWAIFAFLFRVKPFQSRPGGMFWTYLLLASVERFVAEFYRLTPEVAFGLTLAQLISLGLLVVGLFALGRHRSVAEVQP